MPDSQAEMRTAAARGPSRGSPRVLGNQAGAFAQTGLFEQTSSPEEEPEEPVEPVEPQMENRGDLDMRAEICPLLAGNAGGQAAV